jgi:hypothetical protein
VRMKIQPTYVVATDVYRISFNCNHANLGRPNHIYTLELRDADPNA